ISIDCLPYFNLTLEDDISEKTKSSINEILQTWIIAWKKNEILNEKDYTHLFIISPLNKLLGGLLSYVTLHEPEHPTYCSYERKSHFFESSINDDREISDNQNFNQFFLENRQSSDISKTTDEIKDIIINRINERGENNYGYIYPILGEVKLPGVNGENDYKKNMRALNDNFNTIIKYYSKKVKKMKISKKLCELFDGIKLGGIHASGSMIHLMVHKPELCSHKRYLFSQDSFKARNSARRPNDRLSEVQKLNNECSDDSLEGFVNLGEFLSDNILITPSTPRRQ
ncbi:14524_t:CDS:2, partial [Gigaspora rosea]